MKKKVSEIQDNIEDSITFEQIEMLAEEYKFPLDGAFNSIHNTHSAYEKSVQLRVKVRQKIYREFIPIFTWVGPQLKSAQPPVRSCGTVSH